MEFPAPSGATPASGRAFRLPKVCGSHTWGAGDGLGNAGLNEHLEVFLLPIRRSSSEALAQIVGSRNELPRRLGAILADSGHGDQDLAGLGVQ
jgi:hypothetical protein